MLVLKVIQFLSTVGQKVAIEVFPRKISVIQIARKVTVHLATFVQNFETKHF